MPNYVAKNLKTKNTRSIGVIAEDMTIFSIPDIIDGITEYCEEVDYQILLYPYASSHCGSLTSGYALANSLATLSEMPKAAA